MDDLNTAICPVVSTLVLPDNTFMTSKVTFKVYISEGGKNNKCRYMIIRIIIIRIIMIVVVVIMIIIIIEIVLIVIIIILLSILINRSCIAHITLRYNGPMHFHIILEMITLASALAVVISALCI